MSACKYTLVTPFIYKPYALKFWLESFKRLKLPRDQMKLVWLDMSKNRAFSATLKKYLKQHGHEFKKVVYLDKVKKKHKNTIRDPYHSRGENFLERRCSIGETMEILRQQVEGHMVLLEDDVVAPPEAFQKLEEVFNYSKNFLSVCSCSYTRNPILPMGSLLIWNFKQQRVFSEKDSCKEVAISMESIRQERSDGISFVGASSTGFTIYRNTFIKKHRFYSQEGWGQDIMAGYSINELDKYPLTGGKNKVVMCWDVKLPHLGVNDDGFFTIYRSTMCKTEVIDEYGIRF